MQLQDAHPQIEQASFKTAKFGALPYLTRETANTSLQKLLPAIGYGLLPREWRFHLQYLLSKFARVLPKWDFDRCLQQQPAFCESTMAAACLQLAGTSNFCS